ncbi:MAG TPA: MbtH family protein [Actinophytocola sp.]|nr:MbtH family protein [Actinophytocola sp.]
MTEPEDDGTRYAVVVNDEEQYSIWRADQPPPAGWRADGVAGGKQECLEHIERVWTDMRPRSLRERMEREGSTVD